MGELKRQRCEVYSRVVGYLRPVNTWNKGKTYEYKDRITYSNVLKKTKNEQSK